MVAAENGGQCFRLNVLYDWGATMSMVSREAIETMGLAPAKQVKRIVKGLGGVTTVSRGTCTVSLVARNEDLRTVTAWEVGDIASLPCGQPPEDVDEQFPGLQFLSEPNCLSHAHLMPVHVAKSTKFSSQLRLMKPIFGNQYILVGEGAPRLSWCDAMEVDERCEATARTRKRREECRKMAQEARQTALKHTHKLPRKLWDDKNEVKKTNQSAKMKPQGAEVCGSTCKERKKLWKDELTSLTTLVGAVATLLAVITPSEGAETEGGMDWHPKWEYEPGLEGLVNLDYWMVLPLILMIVTGLIMRIKGHLEEIQKPGDEGPILSRVVGADLPADGGGPEANNYFKNYSGKNTGPVWLLLQCSGGVCRGGCFLIHSRE
jgi:hypothetical protein